jgi:thioredoxin-related protein
MILNKLFATLFFTGLLFSAAAQGEFKLYDDKINPTEQIQSATKQALTENKHVLLVIGGNWCKWCKWFDKFSHENFQVDSMLQSDFVVEHINFSKENKNLQTIQVLDFPQRFGFPVFVILDATGKRIHTQQTGYLEENQGYSKEKVMEFLEQWNPVALKAEQYLK